MRKRIWIIVSLLVLLILLWTCPWVSRTYTFSHSPENIVSIQLLINTNESGKAEEDKLICQKSLSTDEIKGFMAEIYTLETRRCYPPMWGWGKYVARVTYSGGDVELLGSGNIEYVKRGSSATGDGPYVFWGYGIFEEVFLRYLD